MEPAEEMVNAYDRTTVAEYLQTDAPHHGIQETNRNENAEICESRPLLQLETHTHFNLMTVQREIGESCLGLVSWASPYLGKGKGLVTLVKDFSSTFGMWIDQ